MALTTQALIEQLLPLNYQSTTTVIASARWTAILAEVGNIVGAELPDFYPFNGTTDTPATPGVIGKAAQWLGAWIAYSELIAAHAIPDADDMLKRYFDTGREILRDIREEPDRYPPEETKTDEQLTFGTHTTNWDIDTDEALLAATSPVASGDPPHILTDTVRISANSVIVGSPGYTAAVLSRMRNGIDFFVRWEGERQSYVFESGRTELHAAGHTIKVTYNWDYRRDRGHGGKNASGVALVS